MSYLEDLESQKSFIYLDEVETLAQDILTAKQSRHAISNAQNKFREALRGLKATEDRISWLKLGDVYIERPTEECMEILKCEIEKTKIDLDNLHQEIKNKTHQLRDVEHEPRLEGFSLKPISFAEVKALHKGFGLSPRVMNEIQYLLLQTSYGVNHWTPPKGHVDPGETEMVTAFRETQEESGLLASDLKIFENAKQVVNYLVKGCPKIVIYWLAELINPNAIVKLSDEHQDFKWLSLEEACSYAKYRELIDTLKFFDEYIRNIN